MSQAVNIVTVALTGCRLLVEGFQAGVIAEFNTGIDNARIVVVFEEIALFQAARFSFEVSF